MMPSAPTSTRPRLPTAEQHRPGRVSHRVIGLGFAAAAVGNAIGTLPQAQPFLQWCHDNAWLPPYGWVLDHLISAAPVVVGVTVVFEAALAAMLLSRRHDQTALALAMAWVVGLIPAIAWPYWLANVALAAIFVTVALYDRLHETA